MKDREDYERDSFLVMISAVNNFLKGRNTNSRKFSREVLKTDLKQEEEKLDHSVIKVEARGRTGKPLHKRKVNSYRIRLQGSYNLVSL